MNFYNRGICIIFIFVKSIQANRGKPFAFKAFCGCLFPRFRIPVRPCPPPQPRLPSVSLRGAKRRGNPSSSPPQPRLPSVSLRGRRLHHSPRSCHCEAADSTTALDLVIARSEATWQSVLLPAAASASLRVIARPRTPPQLSILSLRGAKRRGNPSPPRRSLGSPPCHCEVAAVGDEGALRMRALRLPVGAKRRGNPSPPQRSLQQNRSCPRRADVGIRPYGWMRNSRRAEGSPPYGGVRNSRRAEGSPPLRRGAEFAAG